MILPVALIGLIISLPFLARGAVAISLSTLIPLTPLATLTLVALLLSALVLRLVRKGLP